MITGDTAPSELVGAVAHRADLLVHEATFTEEDADRAAETRHSTARGAAALAAAAEVKLLALTHLSARYPVRDVREEARAEFEATVVPDDFDRSSCRCPSAASRCTTAERFIVTRCYLRSRFL